MDNGISTVCGYICDEDDELLTAHIFQIYSLLVGSAQAARLSHVLYQNTLLE